MAHETVHDVARSCRVYGLLAMTVATACAAGPQALGADIRWRSGAAEVARLDRSHRPAAIAELAARTDARHVVVQFDQPITPAQRKELQQAGLNLLHYVSDNAYFAAFSGTGVDAAALGAMPLLVGAQRVEREWKLQPAVLAGKVPDWAVVARDAAGNRTVAVYILFHSDVPLLTDAINIVQQRGAIVRDKLESINGLVIELPLNNINGLADEDAVQWIEWPLPRLSECNDSSRELTEADLVQAAPYYLDGTGVTVLQYDVGTASPSHVDFEGRLTPRDGNDRSYHATAVAGTIGGSGVARPDYKYRGMAPGVTIESYGLDGPGALLYNNPGDIETDYHEAMHIYWADIANNSIGTNACWWPTFYSCDITGNYGATARLIDTIVRGDGSIKPLFTTPFRIVWANGNERSCGNCPEEHDNGYHSTAPPAGAKNHITVGAVNSNDDSMAYFSSWGPMDDGRIRPDVCAPGCQTNGDVGVTTCSNLVETGYLTACGTSLAAPTVTGLLALLLEDFRARFPTKPDPRNSTLKILLAHKADDWGVDLGHAGPDYQCGYGSVRIKQTIDFMRKKDFLEDQVDQGGTFAVVVPVFDEDELELKVTLAWDDYPAAVNPLPDLVNDLDLRVFDPSSQQHYPWTLDMENPDNPAVQTQADHVNNIEQVLVDHPATGLWRVEVHGHNVPHGPQPFSLCASPDLRACSSRGTIAFVGPPYSCSDTATIRVADCHLNDSGAIDTVTVTISSTLEPGGESVVLTETGGDTGDFRGTITLDTTDSVGVLWVTGDDTVTATYIDADDGDGGQYVSVNAVTTLDCTAPVISNVQTINLKARDATVTFDTNELAAGTVRYSLACAALTEFTSERYSHVAGHEIPLTGLGETFTYFYAVDAVDDAGNGASDDNAGACYTFTTPDAPDYFTELFTIDNDLAYLSLTFTPNGSGQYDAGCTKTIVSLPVDPAGGTEIVMQGSSPVPVEVSFSGGETVSLYGVDYGAFYVTANGYISFHAGGAGGSESYYNHFMYPEVAALFDNLGGGTISWKQLADRAVVTWDNVSEDSTTNSNTFQIEMHFDGTIVLSYLGLDATDGLAGLSMGGGVPEDFYEFDLSAIARCPCDNEIQDQGEERIDCGGPCPPCECLSDIECDDTLWCTGEETCDAYGYCQAGTFPCDDGLFCTGVETCDEELDTCSDGDDPCLGQDCDEDLDMCIVRPSCADDTDCDDGLFCSGVETCVGDTCQAGSDPCPGQMCREPSDTCVDCLFNGHCDDGLFCTGVETCVGGTCQAGIDPCLSLPCNEANDVCTCVSDSDCDDADQCTVDTCDPSQACQNTPVPNGTGCDDGQFCTVDDVCTSGVCGGSLRDCGDECNNGVCDDTIDACLPDPVTDGTPCPDGVFCNGEEICQSGICTDQADPCPAPICNEENDICVSPPVLPPAPHDVLKHRYLSIDPNTNPTLDTVIKVEVAEMRRCQNAPTRACLTDADCDDVCDDSAGDPPHYTLLCPPNDCSLTDPPSTCIWSGPCADLAPNFSPPLAWLVQEPQQQADGEWAAGLSNIVYSENWSASSLLHIGDCGIVPCVTYNVYTCDPADLNTCSEPLEVATQRFPELARPVAFPLYGDVCGGTQLPGPTVLPPDQYANVKDLLVTRLTVINYGSATLPQAHPTWVDLHGPGVGIPPQYIPNVSDLTAVYVFAIRNNLPWVNAQGGLDPQDCPGQLP